MAAISAKASTTTNVWSGSKSFTDWSTQLSIEGSKFNNCQTDDVIRFVIEASSNAQLQVSYGSSWTNFSGLEAASISGSYYFIITKENLSKLKQGIHIKGINYKLTSVDIISNPEDFTSSNKDLFNWNTLFTSGGEKGERNIIIIKPYGGAGWYWQEKQDFSEAKKMIVTFLEPLTSNLIMQVLYGDKSVKTSNIQAGKESFTALLFNLKDVYSVNFMSETHQNLALGSIELMDKDGNVITGINGMETKNNEVKGQQIYNANGEIIGQMQKGFNIIRKYMDDGTVRTYKVICR